jgi:hypothetical protein
LRGAAHDAIHPDKQLSPIVVIPSLPAQAGVARNLAYVVLALAGYATS